MNLFRVPKRLEEIKLLKDPELKKESLLQLLNQIDVKVNLECDKSLENLDEVKLTSLIRKKHQEFISKVLIFIGFLLIGLSAILSIWRSIGLS